MGLFSLFAQDNFSLIAVILGMPLIGAFVNGIWGRRLGKEAVRLMALAAVGISFLAALYAFGALYHFASIQKNGEHFAHTKLSWLAWNWMHASALRGNAEHAEFISAPIDLKFSIDALSGIMMLVVTGVGFLIHLYASTYMEKDKAYWRFFAYLNLFVFSMLVLILGDNLPVLFVGWEGVGLCSYLLIGFWYDKMPNAAAGKKAFIANRIGDFGLIVGMCLLVQYTGALDWNGIANGAHNLVNPLDSMRVHVWPLGGSLFTDWRKFMNPTVPITISAATAVGLMLFLGCTGKSAQIPLYVWLPDAMAGPTPVSALIHAATMVTAGIYLICRLSFVFVLSPFVMMVIACTGAATALLAATIALVQNDIKKVLAYSTVSQLGFMFLGVGVGAFTAGFFHVFTHAFFKACLFLGAGSVIHSMHARIHDDEKSQDMRNMGGLKKYLPYTFWTFAAATAAIIGLPFTSGFFSKDEILFRAYVNQPFGLEGNFGGHALKMFPYPTWIGPTLYFVGLLAATLTAFYMCRALIMTFFGDFRGWVLGRPSLPPPAHHDHGHDDHHEEDLTQPGAPPHESPWQMTVPLVILGAMSIFAGFLNPTLLEKWTGAPMEHWLSPVFEEAEKAVRALPTPEEAHHKEWATTLGAFITFCTGTGIAYWMYILNKGEPAKELAAKSGGLYRLLLDKWRVDEFYAWLTDGVDALAETSEAFDQGIVDGVIAKLSALVVAATGTVLRTVQNGVVQMYAAVMVIGLASFTWFFVAPHADATVAESNGDYTVEAAPGFGYGYKWSKEGGEKAPEGFEPVTTTKVHLEPGKSETVTLEVENVFKLHATKKIVLKRPELDTTRVYQVGQN